VDENLLKGLGFASDHLEHGEKVVDGVVEEGVGQKIRVGPAHHRSFPGQARPHSVKGILAVLRLERQHRVPVEEHAQLLHLDAQFGLPFAVDHRGDEKIPVQDFGLGTLGRDDVLDLQGERPK